MRPFQLLISLEVVKTIENLKRSTRLAIRDKIREIGRDPMGCSDANEFDAKGRIIEITIVDEYALSYWVDSADQQIKILDISLADG